jgi:hypothetical protein
MTKKAPGAGFRGLVKVIVINGQIVSQTIEYSIINLYLHSLLTLRMLIVC